MKTFRDRVAVVTGGASGIGRAMAERFATEGMKVVLADIESAALAATEAEMKAAGASVLSVRIDVAKAAEIEALARKTLSAFGAVHIVCNNAGVASTPVPCWEQSVADWEWVMGVNLWAVIHGIRVFVPILLHQKAEGHVVNTASVAGLTSSPYMSPYNVTKHGVVTLSECLHLELAAAGAAVKVSVLCPAWVNTRIGDSARNRPMSEETDPLLSSSQTQLAGAIRKFIAEGIPPQAVAQRVLNAIRDEQFWILTHPDFKPMIEDRAAGIVAERNPQSAAPIVSSPKVR